MVFWSLRTSFKSPKLRFVRRSDVIKPRIKISCLRSARAQALERASSALAEELLSSSDFCDDIDDLFEAMQSIVVRAFRTAAQKWNRTHDRLSALPMELRSMCWSYLTPMEMLVLASVCASWRDLSRDTPLLWTKLSLSPQRTDIRSIFALSASLPLVVDLWDCFLPNMRVVDECLRTHAARLKRLHISVTGDRDFHSADAPSLFRYPVPNLQRFALLTGRSAGDWGVSPDLFSGCAPKLRSVLLYNVTFPESCAAFSHLTRLKLQGNCGSLEHIYSLAPRVEELELAEASNLRSLPSVPPASHLRKATFSLRALSFARMLSRGYVGLPRLVVSVQQSLALILSAASDCPPSFTGKLSISDTGRAALVLRQDRSHSASFVTTDAQSMDVVALLSAGAAFHTVRHLVLPGELDRTFEYRDTGGTIYPYIPAAGLVLPALRTLTILCTPRGMCSLMDPDVVSGTLTAPLLSRLELSPDPTAEDAGDAVDPCDLALFIEKRLVCDKPDALEVYVDSAGGVRLECRHDASDCEDGEDGFACLQACIGKLIMW
ncbi:hypothetical protein AURDEDRAFT_161726 [Auricularia subglabra TFB-10046 SS5]|nr:hypothetical protein AURDEDRAFT_161726 [Auricularia subglabra TFB-10046 SS5]